MTFPGGKTTSAPHAPDPAVGDTAATAPSASGTAPSSRAPADAAAAPEPEDVGVDAGLERALHRVYDDMLSEPVPEAMLRILRRMRAQDRSVD